MSDLLIKPKKNFFQKLKNFFVKDRISDEMYEELEELLIQSDIGINMSLELVSKLEKIVNEKKLSLKEEVYEELKKLLTEKLQDYEGTSKLNFKDNQLNVILVIGVNGVGKTTTIGKLTSKLKKEGKKILIAAADTFRAAAIEQIDTWAKRCDVDIVKQKQGSDPAAVVYDSLEKAKSKDYDVLIIDTAGRLHNKVDLMKELEKIDKIIKQNVNEYESLIVIDSTTGQNGLEQARIFNSITKITGIILTKYDGTAKGGIIFPIVSELKKPVKYLGVGESIEDLQEFDKEKFVNEMF